MPERDPRQSECSSCKSGSTRLIACAHFDGQVVCLWDYGDSIPLACGPSPEPHLAASDCKGNFEVCRSMREGQADFDRRAELLRLGEPAHV